MNATECRDCNILCNHNHVASALKGRSRPGLGGLHARHPYDDMEQVCHNLAVVRLTASITTRGCTRGVRPLQSIEPACAILCIFGARIPPPLRHPHRRSECVTPWLFLSNLGGEHVLPPCAVFCCFPTERDLYSCQHGRYVGTPTGGCN